MDREPKFKFDLQGLIRTGITIATIIGAYYVDRETTKNEISYNARDIAVLKSDIAQHIKSTKIYTIDELTDRFVLRKEWESNHKALRDEMVYIRTRIDAIYEQVIDKK